MYKQCRTEQSAARQQQVEQCFLRELGQKHYEDISVIDLCALAGISRKSFYRYFSGKTGVLHALLDHTLLELNALLTTNAVSFRQASLGMFFRFWIDRRKLLDALNRSSLLGQLTDRACLFVLQYEGNLAAMPELLRAERQFQVEFLIAGLMRVMIAWYRGGFVQTPEQMAVITSALFPGTCAAQRKASAF